MTRGQQGKCVEIPVNLAGVVMVWLIAVLLLMWGTTGGNLNATEVWGLFTTAVAAVATVAYLLARHLQLLRYAFELGREEANVTTLGRH